MKSKTMFSIKDVSNLNSKTKGQIMKEYSTFLIINVV